MEIESALHTFNPRERNLIEFCSSGEKEITTKNDPIYLLFNPLVSQKKMKIEYEEGWKGDYPLWKIKAMLIAFS